MLPLDEWQRAPRTWDAVRRAVDDRREPGQFILTGSATPNDKVQRHSGAGRFGTLRMRTMSLAEKTATSPTVSVAGLLTGTELTPANSPLTIPDYLHHMRRAHDAPDAPMRQTAQVYLDALRRMMIVDEIPTWAPAVRSSKRLTSTPKRLLADPSLAAALLKMSPRRMLEDLETAGFLFESLVAHDLRIYAEAAGATCYHYREAEGRLEVDYIVETYDGDWMGIEVKMGEAWIDRAAESLHRLADRVSRKPKALVVVTGTSLAYTREDGVMVVPLGLLGS